MVDFTEDFLKAFAAASPEEQLRMVKEVRVKAEDSHKKKTRSADDGKFHKSVKVDRDTAILVEFPAMLSQAETSRFWYKNEVPEPALRAECPNCTMEARLDVLLHFAPNRGPSIHSDWIHVYIPGSGHAYSCVHCGFTAPLSSCRNHGGHMAVAGFCTMRHSGSMFMPGIRVVHYVDNPCHPKKNNVIPAIYSVPENDAIHNEEVAILTDADFKTCVPLIKRMGQ